MGAIENFFMNKIKKETSKILSEKHDHWLFCDVYVIEANENRIQVEVTYRYETMFQGEKVYDPGILNLSLIFHSMDIVVIK